MFANIDWKAVGLGALISAVITVPVSLLAPPDRDSSLNLALFVIVLAGLVLGGFAAARKVPDYPLSNGALAPLLMYVVVQGLGDIRHLATGESVNIFSHVFLAFLATSCGVVGGLFALRSRQHDHASDDQENAS